MVVYDLINAYSDKSNTARWKEWAKHKEDPEIKPHVSTYQFHGRGQRYQDMISFDGALILIMKLGGDFAAQSRVKMARILQGVIAGDPAVLKAVELNAKSDNPLCRMARASLQESPPLSPLPPAGAGAGAGEGDDGGRVGSKRSLADMDAQVLNGAIDASGEKAGALVKKLREVSQSVVDASTDMEQMQSVATGMCKMAEKFRQDDVYP